MATISIATSILPPSKNIEFNIRTTTEKYGYQWQHLYDTQGNRLGFYEKLGEYEARPAYRWSPDEKAFEYEDGGD